MNIKLWATFKCFNILTFPNTLPENSSYTTSTSQESVYFITNHGIKVPFLLINTKKWKTNENIQLWDGGDDFTRVRSVIWQHEEHTSASGQWSSGWSPIFLHSLYKTRPTRPGFSSVPWPVVSSNPQCSDLPACLSIEKDRKHGQCHYLRCL